MGCRFSTDVIENLFSIIRASNRKPDALQFKQILRLEMISRINLDKYCVYTNSQAENLVHNIENFVRETEDETNKDTDIIFNVDNLPILELYTTNSLYYASGYLIKSIMKRNKKCCPNNCIECNISNVPKLKCIEYSSSIENY
uniref:Transposable element P transposase n=1 Tax=Megaselia scalaris TaxID=36166 RepID=T1GGY3_MEGSC